MAHVEVANAVAALGAAVQWPVMSADPSGGHGKALLCGMACMLK